MHCCLRIFKVLDMHWVKFEITFVGCISILKLQAICSSEMLETFTATRPYDASKFRSIEILLKRRILRQVRI
jgi:hypothetical protein